MKYALIGMSGTGKSYWSKKLEERGFRRFCCDDLIEKRLIKILNKKDFYGIEGMARWMGYPFEKRHKKASKLYLDLEREVLEDILFFLESNDGVNVVVDTTGSVIYSSEDILSRLSKQTTIVHLDADESKLEHLYQTYLSVPKPVVWGDIYSKGPREDKMDALAKSYKKLLNFRKKKYEQIARVTISYETHMRPEFSVEQLLSLI